MAGIGGFIGEKTGAYETGKAAYSRIVANAKEQAKELHSKILSDFPEGKELSENEKKRIAELLARLEKASGAKLEDVSWGKAVFNTAQIDPNIESNIVTRSVRGAIGVAQGAVE